MLAGVLAGALAIASCGEGDAGAEGGRPVVLTSFTVIADMTKAVAGDRIAVTSITKPGAEVHGYEPTPSDLRAAAEADLILENGLGLERWFQQFTERIDAPTATLTEGIEPLPIGPGTEYAGKPNPHAWMSTDNAELYVENIRRALTKLDPTGEAEFRANADAYLREIAEIEDTIGDALDRLPAERRALVTCEGAFSYLARDLGLTERYLWPMNAEQEGTPQEIARTIAFVRERKVPAVFCESTVSDKAQRQVARESGAAFGGILYVDSISEPGGPVPSYLELLRHDAATITRGLTAGA